MTSSTNPTASRLDDTTKYAIKVRFGDTRSFLFLGCDGRTVRLIVHAVQFADRDEAATIAAELVSSNERVAAARVVALTPAGSRAVGLIIGEKTPPAMDFSGYRYLRGLRNGRAICEIRDADGRFSNFGLAEYEVCAREAKQAGVPAGRITAYGATATLATRQVRFIQVGGAGQ